MCAERLANLVFFLSDHHHKISSVVQILWLFIAISNCCQLCLSCGNAIARLAILNQT